MLGNAKLERKLNKVKRAGNDK